MSFDNFEDLYSYSSILKKMSFKLVHYSQKSKNVSISFK